MDTPIGEQLDRAENAESSVAPEREKVEATAAIAKPTRLLQEIIFSLGIYSVVGIIMTLREMVARRRMV